MRNHVVNDALYGFANLIQTIPCQTIRSGRALPRALEQVCHARCEERISVPVEPPVFAQAHQAFRVGLAGERLYEVRPNHLVQNVHVVRKLYPLHERRFIQPHLLLYLLLELLKRRHFRINRQIIHLVVETRQHFRVLHKQTIQRGKRRQSRASAANDKVKRTSSHVFPFCLILEK